MDFVTKSTILLKLEYVQTQKIRKDTRGMIILDTNSKQKMWHLFYNICSATNTKQ